MRPHLVVAAILLAAAAGGMALAVVMRLGLPAAAAPLAQSTEPSPCILSADASAQPRVMLLGETTAITLGVDYTCPYEPVPLHVVFVLDGSGSMTGEPSRRNKATAREAIDRLAQQSTTPVQFGVIEFNGSARTLCRLTPSPDQAKSCVARVAAVGPSCVDCGIREGLAVLAAGRAGAGLLNEVMVIMSDGSNNAGCPPVLTAARQAKAQGVVVVTACSSDACGTQCLMEAASSARYFVKADEHPALLDTLDRIAGAVSIHDWVRPRRWIITDTLPANMALVPGSVIPPADISPAGDQLVWTTGSPAPITVTYRLRPTALGTHPTSLGARVTMWDSLDRAVTAAFPVPMVSVLEPFRPMPTATPRPATTTPLPPRWAVFVPKAERGVAP